MLHDFAFAPGNDVNGIGAGEKLQFITHRCIFAVLLADVLLIFVNEFRVFAVGALLVKDDADEIRFRR